MMPARIDNPVFVVGMNGSGTTMLQDCLGRHPELFSFPRETRVFPELLYRNFGDLEVDENFLKAFNVARRIPAFMQMNADAPVPLPADYLSIPRSVPAILDACMQHFSGPVRWIEKTPQHALHMEVLANAWPDARFIHVVRDGRRCSDSFNRRWKRNPVLTITRWKHLVNRCEEVGETLGSDRFLQVRYEDLTTDPENLMRKICSFLDVPFNSNVLVSDFPQSAREGQAGTIQPVSRPLTLSDRQLGRMEAIAGQCLHKHGYTVANTRGNTNPGKLSLSLMGAKDYGIQYLNEFRLKLLGQNRKSWGTILRLPLTALSQGRARRRQKNRDSQNEAVSPPSTGTASIASVTPPSSSTVSPGIVFVTGASRSGTTLLSRILGRHEDIHSTNELHCFGDLIKDVNAPIRDYRVNVELIENILVRISSGIWRGKATQETRKHAEEIAKRMPTDNNRTGADIFDYVIDDLRKSKNVKYVCEHTPRNIFFARSLLAHNPQARLIHVVRDPRAVLASQKHRWKRGILDNVAIPIREILRVFTTFHPAITTRLWMRANRRALELDESSQVLRIRYEDLVEQPVVTSRKITEFLGLPWDASILDVPTTGSSHESSDFSVAGLSTGSLYRWKDSLSPVEIRYCEKLAAPLMQKFDYAVDALNEPAWFQWVFVKAKLPVKLFLAVLVDPKRLLVQSRSVLSRL